jgi:hypothetical protein
MISRDLNFNAAFKKTNLKISIIKYLPLLLIILILYSILVTSLHHHADLKAHAECVLCKFAKDISCGDKIEPFSLIAPVFLTMGFVSERVEHFYRILIFLKNTRSPPFPHLFP